VRETVTKERWQKVADVYDAAQDKTRSQRLPFIREASAGDSDLRRQVESLLAEDDQSGVLDTPIQIAVGEVLNDNAAVQPGSFIGPYRVDTLLGVGGMGEVYRARDTKLNRDVAIKILPVPFANDADRLARFKREAQVLASLNHPNIAAIYGLEGRERQDGQDGLPCLVLELVEGATLADRITHGPLSIDEALAIARQIADALEVAHEQGIIHRDLKPANIKVRDDGTVKVLDFGLAKLADPVGAALQGGPSVTQSPTITTPAMTAAGMILGTAAYMSPEQAKGRPADKRSDIWAFGCVLYEMLTGKRVFEADDVSETLASILRSEPEWSAVPADTPAAIRRVLTRCLRKDARRRFQHMGDVRTELEEASQSDVEKPVPTIETRKSSQVPWMLAAGFALIAAASIVIAFAWRSNEPPLELRVEVSTPPSADTESFAISPDGRMLAFSAFENGRPRLWVRRLDSSDAHSIPGTEDAAFPFWSPDSRNIGFFAAGKLKKTDLNGQSVQPVTSVFVPGGGWWGADNTIYFSPNSGNGAIYRVSQDGGKSEPVTKYVTAVGDRFPQLLPDRRHLLFSQNGEGVQTAHGIYVVDVGAPETSHRLLDADRAVYAAGQLLFTQQGSLFAQPFDPDRLTLSGQQTIVARNVVSRLGGAISASEAGLIAYRPLSGPSLQHFVWFDRSGKRIALVGDAISNVSNPTLSPNERSVLVQRTVNNNIDIWSLDLSTGLYQKVTSEPGIDALPQWLDEHRFVYSSNRTNSTNGADLFERAIEPGSSDTLLFASGSTNAPSDWSPVKKVLLFRQNDRNSGNADIWALSMNDPRTPFPVVRTPADERDAQFSPNGEWIAYQSDESGQPEIYIQPFPGPGRRSRVSTNGGIQVRWNADGHELFYISLDGQLMSVPLKLPTSGDEPKIDAAVRLFATQLRLGNGVSRQQYSVPLDGKRFLVITTDESATQPIRLIINRPAMNGGSQSNEEK
jgi:serine/threonine protein kinase